MDDNVKRAFDAAAAQYDGQRIYVIPEMDRFYDAAVSFVESPDGSGTPVILDIGAGTGLLSALILRKYPDARITLLDISEKMLGVARERFAGNKNISFQLGDYSTADLGGPYDFVCSALSIHHLDHDSKRRLFTRIALALRPGGIFVNADQAEGETPYFLRMYLEYWDEFLRSGPLSPGENAEIKRRRDTLDRNAKLSEQLSWLKEAGFSDVDVVYRNRNFVVTVACKS